jgi:hypothetical protein
MRYLLAAVFSVHSLLSFSQVFPVPNYPQGYFRDPLDIPMSLAANFGELRPDHYHMGLDIRTMKRVNLPVFAAADGYISRVKIEPAGFGQAIYINHPNGYTTLYAHLNQFFPALAAYVQQQQYRLESWKVFITLPPGLFPVKKGDLIAYSGSTGGSQGPHLHFEIRRTADDSNLNPLLFGLPVPDDTPPVIGKLAVYDRGLSVYEQSPRMFPVTRSAAGPSPTLYATSPRLIIVSASRVSFAISAFDTQSGSSNPNGIYQAVLYDNEQPISGFQMDNISYDNTRNINAHIDYKTRETGGPFLQQLFLLPGYTPPSIYRSSFSDGSLRRSDAAFPDSGRRQPDPAGHAEDKTHPPADGVIDLGDGRTHDIRIEVKDAYGNTSDLKYQVQYRPSAAPAAISARPVTPPDATTVAATNTAGSAVPPGTPPPPGKKFYPGMLDGYETDDCAFYIGEKSLYDSVHINYQVSGYPGSGISLPGAVSGVHSIGAAYIPLQDPLLVRIRPVKDLPDTVRDRVVMVRSAGDKKEVQRPEWQGGWASARFRNFGNFQLVEDDQAPEIIPIGFHSGDLLNRSSRIAFMVKDNLGSVRSFRAELDGKWLCFTNDKGLAFIYKFDSHCPAGKHLLKITAEDEAGNRTIKEYSFSR